MSNRASESFTRHPIDPPDLFEPRVTLPANNFCFEMRLDGRGFSNALDQLAGHGVRQLSRAEQQAYGPCASSVKETLRLVLLSFLRQLP